jgi:hypothetical protein
VTKLYVNQVNRKPASADASGDYADGRSYLIGFAHKEVQMRFVVFKTFLKSFSYKKEMTYKALEDPLDPFATSLVQGGLKEDEYKVDIEVASSSAEEARANHYKYQLLLRFAFVKFFENEAGGSGKGGGGAVSIWMSNLIQDTSWLPDAGGAVTRDAILKYGVKEAELTNLDYTPDLELGFYEHEKMFFAKAFSLSFNFTVNGGVGKAFGSNSSGKGIQPGDAISPFGINYEGILKNDNL